MKRIFFFVLFIMLFIPASVNADHMYNVDMDIYIDKYGYAQITEVWDVRADSGTEWYKQLYNLGNSELSDFMVYMDGEELQSKTWNVDETLSEKSGYYGINYTNSGIELCFGKKDFNRHTFTLRYTLSNYVLDTSDSQVLYHTLLPNVTTDNFTVDVTSFYSFPNTLDVWGYGYKGYAYVKDGKISMSNEGTLNGDYVVLLAKFPLNTFNTSNILSGYDSFDDIYRMASEGVYEYNYSDYSEGGFFSFIGVIFNVFIFVLIGSFVIKTINNSKYGYINNKKIDKKNVPMFRDIPCNKDIYYANVLIKLNNFGYKDSNILGAIILKWVRNNKIVFKNEEVGVFNRETSVIDLSLNPTFDNDIEQRLFNMMREASKDEILEAKELEKWCKKNYSEFFSLFTRIENETISLLKSKNYIYNRNDKNECKYKNVMNDQMYNDSIQLYGLKKYLEEFSRMNTKEVMEVKLWDEYLMFAYLFGIADKVSKQLKNMYPDVIEQMQSQSFDYNMLVFINNISTRSVTAASNARSAAESYSSGGGGFSSGGGGGGSFGGGGSMGGR